MKFLYVIRTSRIASKLIVTGEIAEAEAEAEIEMEEYEEEEVEAEHTLSLSQMLNQHRADDNYYGYDDEDY